MTAIRRTGAGYAALHTPVNYLKGVGPRRADAFRRMGIFTAYDLLMHVPHRYEDASTVKKIARVEVGQDVTVIGTVISKGILPTRRGLRIFQAVVRDESGMIEAGWPGQPFLDRTVKEGDTLLLSGPVKFFHGRQLQPRETINLGSDDGAAEGRVLSVYPATEGLSFKVVRSIIDQHLDALLPLAEEYLSPELLALAGVPPLPEALRLVHRPGSVTEAYRGRARLAFEELLCVQLLHLRARDLTRIQRAGVPFVNKRELTSQLRASLPFALTGAQVRSVREIVGDMCSPRRMHRLLQGDVGSGKTIVALFAAALAMENGYQVAVMAPTELLAEQHHRTFARFLAPMGSLEPLLITGSLPAKARRAAATRLASVEAVLAVGTHALAEDSTEFARLGLAVIDEQHRFGVEKRAALMKKGDKPDLLLMSATPIPRSLALTAYGDLDISLLDERPPGRHPVTTAIRPPAARDKVYAFLDDQLAAGRQAYIVYPAIEPSDKHALKTATEEFERLTSGTFKHRRLALLHGRLAAEERDDVMRRFRDGQLDVLVATTVIEVGIDVPNANVMLVEHPERFGLAQLHQLRGRVGRGAERAFCILMSDGGPDGERLKVFVDTDDGFEIARADLRLRGMGDLFGERQSGVPTFRIADPLERDAELNEVARGAAERLLAADPGLAKKENAGLARVLRERYKRALELFRVG